MNKEFTTLFIKELNNLATKYDTRDKFVDFLHIATHALAVAFHNTQGFKWLAENAKTSHAKYSEDEINVFGKCLDIMNQAMELEHTDFLGQVYMEMEISNDRAGQFFTPYHLSQLIAKTTYSEDSEFIELVGKKPFVTVSEPACGAGGMVIALAEHLKSLNIPYHEKMFVVAKDLDEKCFEMAFIQLSLYNIPARVIHGNTITMKDYKYLYTPAVFLYDWETKFSLYQMLNVITQFPAKQEIAYADTPKISTYDFEPQTLEFID